MKRVLCSLLLAAAAPWALAQATPVGVWKTIDDKTKTERAQVRISEAGEVYTGTLEKLLAPDANQEAVCDKCSDDRKGQPIVGMEIMRDVKKAPADNTWSDGTILDAAEGKIYKVRLQLADQGRRLEVRGYVGAPVFGRTQNWIRVE